MKEYEKAQDVEMLAEGLAIPKWHQHLLGVAIAYLFTENLDPKGGKEVLAKIRKATPFEAFFANVALVMIVGKEAWFAMTAEQRIALVDHELCHAGVENGVLKLRAHDLEEFADVVKRHGLWKSDLIAFRENCGQLDLFGPDTLAPDAVETPAADIH